MTVAPHAFGVGLFIDFADFDIPAGVDLVRTSGYAAAGRGEALYAAVPSGPATAWRVQDANGRWFELSESVPTPQMFGAVADGAVNDTQALKDAIAFAGGGQVYMPGGVYVVNQQIDVLSTANPNSAFGPGLHLVGAGMADTIIDNQCSNESLFYLNSSVHVPFTAQIGVKVASLTVTRQTSGVNSGAFELVNAYQVQFDQVTIEKQQGSGVILKNGDYIDDGWNSIALSNLWIDGCTRWGIEAAGGYARNEGSFSKLHNVFIRSCGTNAYFTVSNVSNAAAAEVTVLLAQLPRVFPQRTAHPFVEGDRIMFFGVQGMTQINDVIYKVGPNPTSTTFKLYTNVLPSSPVGAPVSLAANPFTTAANSRTVTVAAASHGAAVGDYVRISGATPVGGVAISGPYEIVSVVDANTYTIYANTAAISAATGGGAVVQAAYALATPVNSSAFGVFASGMATGALPNNPFTTVSGQSVVTVTHAAHSGVAGGVASFSGAAAVGGLTLNGSYAITQVIDANSYRIQALSNATSSASGGGASVSVAYADGPTKQAEVSYFEPRSGGLLWKGQLLHLLSCGFTLNQNVAQFIPGDAGLATGALCEQVTWENSYRRHLFCTGIDSFTSIASQFHGAEEYPTWVGVEFNAWRHLIRGVTWDGTAVRSSRNRSLQWKLAGANVIADSCRVRRTMWQDFDYADQRRFEGWRFDQIEDDGLLRHVTSNPGEFISFGPSTVDGSGNKTPMRMRGPNGARVNGQWPEAASTTGEWIELQLSGSGLVRRNSTDNLAPTGPNNLAKDSIYNVFLYDADGAPFLALANTADAGSDYSIDPQTGYAIRTSDPSMRWVGRVKTDNIAGQAAKFLTTAESNYLAPSRIAGSQTGSSDWFWQEPARRRLWFKSGALPTSQDGGSYALWATFEAEASYDPPSLPAGGSASHTLAATCSLGDYVVAASFSVDQAGVTLHGYVSAANQITVVLTNTTAGTVDLGSGTLRAIYQRR